MRVYTNLNNIDINELNFIENSLSKFNRTSGIYCLFNIITKKFYIGSAINLYNRLNSHIFKLRFKRHCNKHLLSSFNKYGEDNFLIVILEIVNDKNKLIEREQYFLDKFLFAQEFIRKEDKRFQQLGYNILALAGSSLGHKMSEEVKLKLKEKAKGRKPCELARINARIAIQNKIYTEEERAVTSKIHKGKIVSLESRLKMSKSRTGKKQTPEHIENSCKKLRKIVLQYSLDGKLLAEFKSTKEAGTIMNCAPTNIARCCRGKLKTCVGYNFKYKK